MCRTSWRTIQLRLQQYYGKESRVIFRRRFEASRKVRKLDEIQNKGVVAIEVKLITKTLTWTHIVFLKEQPAFMIALLEVLCCMFA